MSIELRKCSCCGFNKELNKNNFEIRKDNGKFRGKCKECHKSYYKNYCENNKERKIKYDKTYNNEIRFVNKSNTKSKGENKITENLILNKIEFEQEKTFNNCISRKGSKLYFDFYLPKQNIIIEYDGEFHFNPTFGFERFLNGKIHDYIKNKFCRENNIELIRIPYWDFEQIPKIIKYGIKNLN